MDFDAYLSTILFDKFNMDSTGLTVKPDNISRLAHSNLSMMVNKEGDILTDCKSTGGVVHDPKAQAGFIGHAGYFSSPSDLQKLNMQIISGNVISNVSIKD